jgi:type II secretory pathway component PulM
MISILMLEYKVTQYATKIKVCLNLVCFECSVVGAILIVIGLYAVLWGKYKENKEKEREAIKLPVALKSIEGNGTIIEVVEIDEVELEKVAANNRMSSSLDQAVIAVSLHMQDDQMKARETTPNN